MDDIAYLNQIAKDNRVVAYGSTKEHIIEPKWIKFIALAGVAIILMMIVGIILGSRGGGEREMLDKIYLRTENLSESISNYDEKVKSSELRSMGNSLLIVLRETNAKVAGILTANYESVEPSEELTASETEYIASVNGNLEYGRISGLLDRYFVREMSREIVLLQSLETEAIEESSSAEVKEVLASSWNNLNTLAGQFETFSDLAN